MSTEVRTCGRTKNLAALALQNNLNAAHCAVTDETNIYGCAVQFCSPVSNRRER
jgi:hypothetical protein